MIVKRNDDAKETQQKGTIFVAFSKVLDKSIPPISGITNRKDG
jgi:hypothetical protein